MEPWRSPGGACGRAGKGRGVPASGPGLLPPPSQLGVCWVPREGHGEGAPCCQAGVSPMACGRGPQPSHALQGRASFLSCAPGQPHTVHCDVNKTLPQPCSSNNRRTLRTETLTSVPVGTPGRDPERLKRVPLYSSEH
ncbi:hypothetical protein HJG60_009991 [Phyllostomus discolor]|uniref:Uncharacterized protein n=1 Tax=Phyllostomus discolor TaxID=89673 RepID=A0A834BA34_9CHIR|nr:hypothetical protein HJG60_009991 [Phyllostomus discolor]